MAARGIALFLALVVGCSSDDGDSGPQAAAGAGGASTGSGGSKAGGRGGMDNEAGAPAAGAGEAEAGQTGSGGDAVAAGGGGEGGALDNECPACRLLRSVSYSNPDTFVSDGTSIFVRGGDWSASIAAIDIDGSNSRNFTIPDCTNPQRGAQVHDGFVYYFPRLASASPSWISRWPIPELSATETTCEEVLRDPEDEGIVNFFIDEAENTLLATYHDTTTAGTLVGLDLSNLKDTVILDLTNIRVGAVDTTSYYGTENPAGGSGSAHIIRLDRQSLETTTLETMVYVPDVLHVDDQFLYYADGNAALFRLPKDAAQETTATAIPGSEGAFRIGVDGTDVVFFYYAQPGIYRMPLAGGEVTRIPSGPNGMRALIWDEQNYYFLASAAPPDQDSGYELWALQK